MPTTAPPSTTPACAPPAACSTPRSASPSAPPPAPRPTASSSPTGSRTRPPPGFPSPATPAASTSCSPAPPCRSAATCARHRLGHILRRHLRHTPSAQPRDLVAHRAGLPPRRLPLRQRSPTPPARRSRHRPDPHPRSRRLPRQWPHRPRRGRHHPPPAARPHQNPRLARKSSPTSTASSSPCLPQPWSALRADSQLCTRYEVVILRLSVVEEEKSPHLSCIA